MSSAKSPITKDSEHAELYSRLTVYLPPDPSAPNHYTSSLQMKVSELDDRIYYVLNLLHCFEFQKTAHLLAICPINVAWQLNANSMTNVPSIVLCFYLKRNQADTISSENNPTSTSNPCSF